MTLSRSRVRSSTKEATSNMVLQFRDQSFDCRFTMGQDLRYRGGMPLVTVRLASHTPNSSTSAVTIQVLVRLWGGQGAAPAAGIQAVSVKSCRRTSIALWSCLRAVDR